MAKKKKPKPNRPEKYEKSTLKINGSLDDVLKVSFASAKKPNQVIHKKDLSIKH